MDPCFCSFGGVRNELITELDVAESMNTSLINLQEANSNRMLFVQSLLRYDRVVISKNKLLRWDGAMRMWTFWACLPFLKQRPV